MRVGCGSATIGIFAKQWLGHVDEVIVVDDHITGVLSEHQAGSCLDMRPAGIRVRGRRSTPGRYFQVAEPGHRLGRHRHRRSARDHRERSTRSRRWPGLRLLMVSTTGEHRAYFVLDDDAAAAAGGDAGGRARRRSSASARTASRRCASVLFMAGAGGSLRAGVTENPVRLTRSVQGARWPASPAAARRSMSGRAAASPSWSTSPRMPDNAFGYVPTPALVAPIEFTMRRDDYAGAGRPHGPRAAVEERCCRGARRRRARRRQSLAAAAGGDRMSRDRPGRALLPDGRAAPAARADRPGHRGLGRRRARSRAAYAQAAAALRRPCWPSSSPSCRCCARRSAAAAAAPARWRGAWWRPAGAIRRPASSRRWPRWPARSPTRCWRRCCAGRRSQRAYVNNGGDIALHLAPGERLRYRPGRRSRPPGARSAAPAVARGPRRCAASPPAAGAGAASRFGIADAVTVLARDRARRPMRRRR